MEPFSVGAVFACINSCFKFAEYAVRVAEVGTENEVFVRTIQVVRNDLNETERLLSVRSVQAKLVGIPHKFQWIKGCIHSTKSALNEIGKWVERARGEQHATGSVKFETRVRWVFNDHEKLINRQAELSMCHQQLSNVLNYLIPLEEAVPTVEPPSYNDTTSFDEILSPRQRRMSALKETTVTVSQLGKKSAGSTTSSAPTYNIPALERSTRAMPVGTQVLPCSGHPTCMSTSDAYQSTFFMPTSEALTIASDTVSPPCSPPPLYSSLIAPKQTGRIFQGASDGTRNDGWQNTIVTMVPPSCSQSEGSNLAKPLNPLHDRKALEIWAHKYEQPNEVISELQGDFPALGATNREGPVNPFELFGGEVPPERTQDSLTTRATSQNGSRSAELVGDMSFSTELPSSDLAPPPRHSQMVTRRVISALPTDVERRCAVSMNSFNLPLSPIYELPARQSLQNLNPAPTTELPASISDTLEATGPYHGPAELPTSSFSSVQGTQQNSSSLHSPWSSRSAPPMAHPIWSPLTDNPSPCGLDQRVVSPLVSSIEPFTGCAQTTAPKRSGTAASVRMQRQRAFMDMLGSIDQT